MSVLPLQSVLAFTTPCKTNLLPVNNTETIAPTVSFSKREKRAFLSLGFQETIF